MEQRQSLNALVREYASLVERRLDECIPPTSRVAFLDFPYDTNVGNHMMWLGGMHYLRQRRNRLVYSAHHRSYRPDSLRRCLGNGVIVMSGGVGLTSLWPASSGLKSRVARDFPDNPIVVLPSTVWFRSTADRDVTRTLFGHHRNVTILARDHQSQALLQQTLPSARVVLTPDVAFLLGPQPRARPPESAISWLARTDVESAGHVPPPGVLVFDWSRRSLYSVKSFPAARVGMRVAGAASRLRNSVPLPPLVQDPLERLVLSSYGFVARRMLRTGNHDLDRAAVLVTDRFHAHILAILRNQPVILLPDAYGKNRASFESWTYQFPNVHFAESDNDAYELAMRISSHSVS